MRASEVILFAWLTILSLLFSSNAPSAQCNTANHDHSTLDFIADADITDKICSPIATHSNRDHPESLKPLNYGLGQLRLIVWSCCTLGLLYTVIIIYSGARPPHGQDSDHCRSELKRHPVGRTSPVVSCHELSPLRDLGEREAYNSDTPGANRSAKITRGRQFASHGPTPDFPNPHLPTSQNPWDIKEPSPASYGRQVWMSALAIENQGQMVKSPDQELGDLISPLSFSTRRYPVHASPPRIQPRYPSTSGGAPRSKRAKLKYRLVPYLCLVEPKIKCRYRGSTSDTVKIHLVKKKTSLATSLYGDSRFLRPIFFAWFILIVGVNYGPEDPEHDLEFWRKMLRDPELESEAIYLVTLAGNEATLENIENALSRLFRDSEALGISGRTRLFVYITGEGNDQNMMHLPNNEVLSKEDVNQWLWKLRATWGYSRTITLVLDICRTNEDDPHMNMHDGTELVFSCSPGEEALALKFSRDTPHSCFMLAFVLASPISPRCSSAKLVATVEQRLGQLTEIGREAALNAGKGGEVSGPQQPNWAQRSDGSTFLGLARMLSRTRVVHEVYHYITQLSYFPGNATSLDSALAYGPLPKDGTTQHFRGVNKHAPVMNS